MRRRDKDLRELKDLKEVRDGVNFSWRDLVDWEKCATFAGKLGDKLPEAMRTEDYIQMEHTVIVVIKHQLNNMEVFATYNASKSSGCWHALRMSGVASTPPHASHNQHLI